MFLQLTAELENISLDNSEFTHSPFLFGSVKAGVVEVDVDSSSNLIFY